METTNTEQYKGQNLAEKETPPKVLFTFHGYSHDDLNIQGVNHIRDSLTDHLGRPFGRKTIFLEFFDATPPIADRIRRATRDHGFVWVQVDALLASMYGRSPSERDTQKHTERLLSSDINETIYNGLLPRSEVQHFFINKVLDELREKYSLDLLYETHQPQALIQIRKLKERYDEFNARAFGDWEQGKFDQALQGIKISESTIQQLGLFRDNDVIPALKDKVKALAKQPEGGSIFALYGGSHDEIVDLLSRQMPRDLKIIFEKKNFIPENSQDRIPRTQFVQKKAPEIAYAQILLHEYLIHGLEMYFFERREIGTYALNWEDIERFSTDLATKFPMEDIKKICEDKVPAMDLVKANPESIDNLL